MSAKRLWYTLSVLVTLLIGFMIWMKRQDLAAALQQFGARPDTPQPKVTWSKAPDLSEYESGQGSSRLRHIIGRLLQPNAIAYEAILTFDSEAAFQDFLARPGALNVLGTIPALKSVRIGFDDVSDLNDIPENANTAPNYLVQLPTPQDPEGPGIQEGAVPFGSSALSWLGIVDNAEWGLGKSIAIIDTGIEQHPTFNEDQYGNFQDLVDVADGTATEVNGHGTAVASVAAGNHPAAPGVAPGAELLSFRVADSDGNSDSFTLAQGIIAAADAGADVINISLGSTGDSSVVRDAVDYAFDKGSTIVAAAGNNGTQDLTFPAAYEGVISVGSVDALGQHLDFSNTSDELTMAAPGYGIPAAWPNEQVIQFTGTSASAPFVSGAIAAIMSWDDSYSSSEALSLLQTHSNEAGAPGYDNVYGEGILNLGRVLQDGQAGIYDAAVASHHYAGDPNDNGREIMQVVIENRGTEILYGSTLSIQANNNPQKYVLGPIKPGEVIAREVVVDTRFAELNGSVSYDTSLTLPDSYTDQNPNDNQLTSTFVTPEAEVEVVPDS